MDRTTDRRIDGQTKGQASGQTDGLIQGNDRTGGRMEEDGWTRVLADGICFFLSSKDYIYLPTSFIRRYLAEHA